MKKLSALLVSAVLLFSFAACASDRFMKEKEIKKIENPTGTINISYLPELDGERQTLSFEFELFYDKAPITVTNFVSLVNQGFYNNVFLNDDSSTTAALTSLSFLGSYQETVDGELVSNQKALDYTIKGEYKNNGWETNDVAHDAWTFSMIRDESAPDSADFKFMITIDKMASRNNNFAAFARIKASDKAKNDLIALLSDNDISNPQLKIETIVMAENTPNLGKPLTIKK